MKIPSGEKNFRPEKKSVDTIAVSTLLDYF